MAIFLSICQAVDVDKKGTPNSQVSYQITAASRGLLGNFSIDDTSGEITVTNPLDYESLDTSLGGKVELTITAFDAGEPKMSSEVYVNVTVEVSNILGDTGAI